MSNPAHAPPLEMWGGVECTVVRVGGEVRNQIVDTGHSSRMDDLDAWKKLARAHRGVTQELANFVATLPQRSIPAATEAVLAKAVVESLEEYPVLNASVEGSDIVFHDDVYDRDGAVVAQLDGPDVTLVARPSQVARCPA